MAGSIDRRSGRGRESPSHPYHRSANGPRRKMTGSIGGKGMDAKCAVIALFESRRDRVNFCTSPRPKHPLEKFHHERHALYAGQSRTGHTGDFGSGYSGSAREARRVAAAQNTPQDHAGYTDTEEDCERTTPASDGLIAR